MPERTNKVEDFLPKRKKCKTACRLPRKSSRTVNCRGANCCKICVALLAKEMVEARSGNGHSRKPAKNYL